METTFQLKDFVDFSQRSFWVSMLFILGSPLTWNVLGRIEYHTLIFTRIFRSKFIGCYFFAAYIWLFSFCRNLHFDLAIEAQPSLAGHVPFPWLELVRAVALVLYVSGIVLVVSSSWALGVLGTYNGDYFRILMEEKITQFPFSVVSNPMYTGSTMVFFAHALWHLSPAGFLLSAWVFICYQTGLMFEEPFTNYIYTQAEKLQRKTILKQQSHQLKEQLLNEFFNDSDSQDEPQSESSQEVADMTEVRRLEEWTMDEVGSWLQTKLELNQYVETFRSNHVDGSVLSRLDLAMLKIDLQVTSLGHRFKILDAIARERKNNHKKQASNKWISERRAIEEKVVEVMMQNVLFAGLKKRLNSMIPADKQQNESDAFDDVTGSRTAATMMKKKLKRRNGSNRQQTNTVN